MADGRTDGVSAGALQEELKEFSVSASTTHGASGVSIPVAMAEVMADVPPEPAVVAKDESRRDRSRDRGSEDRRRDRDRRDDREERGRRDSDRRDRDRDYKRRKSGTPPAGGSYRDRRHSPRRSSPPYKRRRDDEFDGRRGSPGDDRRYFLGDLERALSLWSPFSPFLMSLT